MGLYYTLFVTPVIVQFYFWDKRRQERLIRASGLDWTIVRPGALTNGRPRGAWRTGTRIGNPIWTVRIARADVAHFVLDQLASRSTSARPSRSPGETDGQTGELLASRNLSPQE